MSSTTELGGVVDVAAGQPAPPPNEFSSEGTPFIRAGSLEGLLNGSTEDDCEKVALETAQRRGLRLFPTDTVLFAKSGMSAKLGRVYRLRRPSYVVSHLAALAPTGRYHPGFLAYWLRQFPPSSLIRDDAYPSIRVSEIEELQVPDIDVDEQERIASILDKADTIRRKREKTLALSDDLLRSAFLDMFGDPATNPKNWPTVSLGETGIVSGGLQVTSRRDALELRKPYLRVANVYRDRLELSEIKEIGLTRDEFERTRLREGDVLIVEGHGNPGEIGRSAVWNETITDCVHQNHLIRFRANQQLILPVYVSTFLNSASGRRQLVAAGRTTSGLNTISTRKVKEVVIPLPRLDIQKTFDVACERIRRAKGQLETAIRDGQAFFSSLSQRAFSGEL